MQRFNIAVVDRNLKRRIHKLIKLTSRQQICIRDELCTFLRAETKGQSIINLLQLDVATHQNDRGAL